MPIDMAHIAYVKDPGSTGSFAVARPTVGELADALEQLAMDATYQASVLRNSLAVSS